MDNTRIREASLEDLEFLYNLECTCFSSNQRSSRRSLKTSISSDNQQIYILEESNGSDAHISVGSAIVIFHKKSLRIYSIAVDATYRGRGFGDFLLRYIVGVAQVRGFTSITLEADCDNHRLVEWYKGRSFEVTERVDDYYGKGHPAYRMVNRLGTPAEASEPTGNIIVVDQVKKLGIEVPGVEVVSARDYLSAEQFRNSERYHVLNLCNSYKTHSMGYYVSLLASARNHRVVPSVMTVKDISNITIAQSLLDEIKEFVHSRFSGLTEETIELPVILGKTPKGEYADLAKRLFALFEIPFFSITFARNGSWKVKKLSSLSTIAVAKTYPVQLHEAIASYFQKKRHRRTQLKKYKYDLSILINSEEKTAPSCPDALEKFRKAAEQVGFSCEFITKIDYRRLCEFDALFIRETTAIDNHTYRFARHAYTEGLVVIDDPWSILLCSNKIYLHERLVRGRIKQPTSWLLTKGATSSALMKSLPFPLVLKLPESSFSKGVYQVHNPDELHEKLNLMFDESDLVIGQEFLESGFDWRIGVLDNTPLFACKYFMANGHWQVYNWANSNQADVVGLSEAVPINQVPASILKAAVKSSSLIGDGLYGVDLKEINGQAYVIEINDNPNIDEGVEDKLLQDELYLRLMNSIFNRIERERHKPRYLL